MDVILDTNIYRQDLTVKSARFDVLLDYAVKTNSRIFFPTLVRDELAAHITREVRDRQSRLASAAADIARLLPHRAIEAPVLVSDPEKEVGNYLLYLQKRLRIRAEHVVSHQDSYLSDVIARAIARRRPCSDSGEEIRDAVLWLTVLDLAAKCEDKTVAFISNNKKQFAGAGDCLHDDLISDCASRNVTVLYFTSLEEFVRQHATKVSFATTEWFETQIDPIQVLENDEVIDLVVAIAERQVGRKLSHDEHLAGSGQIMNADQGKSGADIYLYEMADGSFRAEINYPVVLTVRFPVNIREYHPAWDERGYLPSEDRVTKDEIVECYLMVEASIRDQAVVDWSVIDVQSM